MAFKNLICSCCECFLPLQDYISPYGNEKPHVNEKPQTMEKHNNENVLHDVNSKIDKKAEIDLLDSQYIKETKISSTAVEINNEQLNVIVRKCNSCNASLCNKTCIKTIEQKLLDNKIIINECNDFSCITCNRNIKSLHDIVIHIGGKRHKNTLKSYNENLNISKDGTNKKQSIDVTCSNNATNVDLNQKYSLNNGISVTNSDTNTLVNNTYKTISVIDDFVKNKDNKVIETGKADIVLQNDELCNMEDDIITFKCFCCKSIMQGNSLLIDHLSSTSHLSNLINVLKHLESGIEVFTRICKSIQIKLQDNNFPLCVILVPKIQNACTYFSEKRFIYFNILDIKCYNDIKNNILYHCSFCNVKMNTDHNLINHCKAKMHLWKMKKIFFTKNQSSLNDIAKIQTQISEVAINDKDFNNDFIITEDVRAQITSSLSVSPLDKKTQKAYKPKENLAKRLNKAYSTKYLEIEKEMYTVEKKLNYIRQNLKLIMPYDIKYFYCLACNEKISKELYSLYEHICLQLHIVQINEIKKDTKSKKLLNQYMIETSKDRVKCSPCGNYLSNDIQSIETHIHNGMHKRKYKMFVKVIDNAFNSISQDINNLWYSIQRFCCVFCQQNFKYKVKFLEHIAKKHTQLLKHQMYDFCIPCATLWLGKKNSYTEHCGDIVHRYLIRSRDFIIEDLPDNMIKILTQVDEVSDNLFQQTQLLLNDNIHWEVKQCLENRLKSNFPAVKIFVFGSRITGLGFPDSDIDIFIDCGNRYNQNANKNFIEKHLRNIKDILYLHEKEWEVKEIVEEARVPIIKLVYKRIGLCCDISVTNGLSVENSKLIRSFNDAYLPCRKLILFVKKWLSEFNLSEKHGLSNYALAWLVIFYLQSKSYLPSVARLIKEKKNSKLICGWETGVAQPKSDKPEQSISILLIGFFQFYANFDYQRYIICPLMGHSLTKQAFAEPQTLPTEMKLYIEQLNSCKNSEYFRIDTPLCVQDPFVLSFNLTRSVTNITLKYFKQYCQDSASILLCPAK